MAPARGSKKTEPIRKSLRLSAGSVAKHTSSDTPPKSDPKPDPKPAPKLVSNDPTGQGRTLTLIEPPEQVDTKTATYRTRWLRDVETNNKVAKWSVKAWHNPGVLFPAQIVMATEAHFQNDHKLPFPDPEDTVRIHRVGPVSSKQRPMVVLWLTPGGLLCLPFYRLKQTPVENFPEERQRDFITVVNVSKHATSAENEKWEGKTPWWGKPLRMEIYRGVTLEEKAFIDIARPTWISQFEPVKHKVGHLKSDSYMNLVNIFRWRMFELRTGAFKVWGVETNNEPPTEPDPDKTELTEEDKRLRKFDEDRGW